MNERNILQKLIVMMLVLAMFVVIGVLWQAASSSEPEREDWLVFDLTMISEGGFSVQNCQCDHPDKILLLWQSGGKMSAYRLKQKNGQTIMPNVDQQWQGDTLCRDFSPETSAIGRVKSNGKIICHDVNTENASKWAWSLSGRALTPNMPDLLSLQTERKGQYLHIYP